MLGLNAPPAHSAVWGVVDEMSHFNDTVHNDTPSVTFRTSKPMLSADVVPGLRALHVMLYAVDATGTTKPPYPKFVSLGVVSVMPLAAP